MFYTILPRSMKDIHIRLRPLRIFDGPFLRAGLNNREALEADGFTDLLSLPSLSLWWLIKKTFTVVYCIECDSKPIGLIGLYNLELGKSAELTLLIFEKNFRRLGYGTTVFTIFAKYLKGHSIAENIIVRIKTSNIVSISFWKKLGFKEISRKNDIQIMYMDLDGFRRDTPNYQASNG